MSSKAEKEAFVSGLGGTSPSEVLAIACALPLLAETLGIWGNGLQSKSRACFFSAVALSFSGVAAVTHPRSYLPAIYSMLFIFWAVAFIRAKSNLRLFEKEKVKQLTRRCAPSPALLTVFRSTMMVYTAISILGVDFHVFPRRLAKTETFGTGLMDLGVGSFVLSGGLTSRSARRSVASNLDRTLRKTIPLLALGLLRLFTLKGIDYQEHTSEYGQHWNFFFTLAAVSLASFFLENNFPRPFLVTPGISGFALFCVYEALLGFVSIRSSNNDDRTTSLEAYVLSPHSGLHPRASLVARNKEGVASLVGFVALHFIGCGLGRWIFRGCERGFWNSTGTSPRNQFIIQLWHAALVSVLFSSVAAHRISRRLCNAAYGCWVTSIFLCVASLLCTLRLVARFSGVACVDSDFLDPAIACINARMLFVFLLANALTGLTNVSIDTMSVAETPALALLLVYGFIVCGTPCAIPSIRS